MTRDETTAILGVLQTAFPAFYRTATRQDAMNAIVLWSELFADDPAEIVSAAVKALIATKTEGYPPTIGEVKAKMQALSGPGELAEGEAWALVEKATRNGIYGYREEFEKLPPVVQKAVGSANQLREWATLNSDELKTVVASNFMRSYKTIQKRENEIAMIPADVRSLLTAVADRLSLPGGAP